MSFRNQGKSRGGSPLSAGQLPWSVIYYLAASGSALALDFLFGCSPAIRAQFAAVLDAVAAALPPRFSGGGLWEAARRGLSRPAVAVITGMRKPWRTAFSERDYEYVRHLGDEHRQNFPRKLAQ